MNATELFIKAVEYHLQKGFTQVTLAKELGIQPQQVNSFLKGRRNFSDERKEDISKIFGKSYLEMLNIGHFIMTGNYIKESYIPINFKNLVSKLERLSSNDLKLIDDLANRLSRLNS